MIICATIKINISRWGRKSKGDNPQFFVYVNEHPDPVQAIAFINHYWDSPLILSAVVVPQMPQIIRGVLLTPDTLREAVLHGNPEIGPDENISFKMPPVR